MELARQPWRCLLRGHGDGGQPPGPVRGAVLQLQLPWPVEKHVDHGPFRGRQQHLGDEFLVLDPAAVAADEFHLGARQRHVEDPGVGGVGQPQPHNFPGPRGQREVGLAADQQHSAEPAHRRVRRLVRAERGDLAVLQQQVIQGQHHVPVGRGPVAGLRRDHQDVPVQAHLLGVVLADMRVIPVHARVGEPDPVGEVATDRDWGLGFVGDPVVLVLQAQPMPVHGRVQITLVGDVDDHLGPLLHLQRRARDGAVVAQHPHGGLAQRFRHWADPQVEGVVVVQLQQLRPGCLGQPGGVGRKELGRQADRAEGAVA